jgi:hypothetical protein
VHHESRSAGRHDFDAQNRALFLSSWAKSLLPDTERVKRLATGTQSAVSVLVHRTTASDPDFVSLSGWEWHILDGEDSQDHRRVLGRCSGDNLLIIEGWRPAMEELRTIDRYVREGFPVVLIANRSMPAGLLMKRHVLEEVGLPERVTVDALAESIFRTPYPIKEMYCA